MEVEKDSDGTHESQDNRWVTSRYTIYERTALSPYTVQYRTLQWLLTLRKVGGRKDTRLYCEFGIIIMFHDYITYQLQEHSPYDLHFTLQIEEDISCITALLLN